MKLVANQCQQVSYYEECMDALIKKIIQDKIDYIEKNDFTKFYDEIYKEYGVRLSVGVITDILYQAGIDPLKHMSVLPKLFLEGSQRTSITVPENILTIDNGGLAFSDIRDVLLHNNCEISEACFYQSKIVSITIPYIMNEIPTDCFYGCKQLRFVDLNSIDQIEDHAFAMCPQLTSIYIPDDVNFISDGAFFSSPTVLHFHSDNEYAIEYCERTGREYKFV